MTSALQKAIAVVVELPVEDQDRIAEAMMRLVRIDEEHAEIDPDHLEGVLEGLAQVERGEFASDEEVRRVFRRFGE